jgi:hypothetical protein
MRTYIKESSGDANIRRAALAALIDSEQTIREALALGGVEAGRAECERIAARELELAAQNGLAQPE